MYLCWGKGRLPLFPDSVNLLGTFRYIHVYIYTFDLNIHDMKSVCNAIEETYVVYTVCMYVRNVFFLVVLCNHRVKVYLDNMHLEGTFG